MIDAAAASISKPSFPLMQRETTVRGSHVRRSVTVLRVVALLLGLLLVAFAGRARADCWPLFGQPGSVAFAPPAVITLPNSLPVGTVLWTSPPVSPTNPPTFVCTSTANGGVQNSIAGQPTGSDDTLFPTNISGLSYRLLYPDTPNPLHAYPNQPTGTGFISLNGPTALQLVVAGPITPGSVLAGGQLAQWNVDMCNFHNGSCRGNPVTPTPVQVFSTSGITFVAPACTVAVDPTVVTLPTVYASAFSGAGTTTGQTPFNVQLTCSGKVNLAITLATSNPQAGATGVIAPTSGPSYAQNVGVQLLDGSGNPVSFGTAISAGQTAIGPFNIPFSARYYQTGANASAGKVTATATYTLTYQ